MPFLQTSALPQCLPIHSERGAAKVDAAGIFPVESKVPLSTSSIATLVRVARKPVESVAKLVKGWHGDNVEEARSKEKSLAQRKRMLYLQLRDV